MRAVVIGASLAFATQTMADPEVHMEKLMGKGFMVGAASPQHVGHMRPHPGVPVAPLDTAPATNFRASSHDLSTSSMQVEIFKLQEMNERMKAELENFKSGVMAMKGPQAQAIPNGAQRWTDMLFGFGYGICSTFILSILYKVFNSQNRGAPTSSKQAPCGAELQSSAMTTTPLILTNAGLRTAGFVMSQAGNDPGPPLDYGASEGVVPAGAEPTGPPLDYGASDGAVPASAEPTEEDGTEPIEEDGTKEDGTEPTEEDGTEEDGASGVPEPTPTELKAMVEGLATQLADEQLKSKELLYSLAELQNKVNRHPTEIANAKKYGIIGFAEGLVEVADNFERALETTTNVDASTPAEDVLKKLQRLYGGIQGVERLLMTTLRKYGVEKIVPEVGKDMLDTNVHEAMTAVAAESEADTIEAVMASGWKIGDRIIRAAQVAVSQGPEQQENADAEANEK